MKPHDYITVRGRRWCVGCGTYQVYRGGKWRDDPSLLGPWPGYNQTQPFCQTTD